MTRTITTLHYTALSDQSIRSIAISHYHYDYARNLEARSQKPYFCHTPNKACTDHDNPLNAAIIRWPGTPSLKSSLKLKAYMACALHVHVLRGPSTNRTWGPLLLPRLVRTLDTALDDALLALLALGRSDRRSRCRVRNRGALRCLTDMHQTTAAKKQAESNQRRITSMT